MLIYLGLSLNSALYQFMKRPQLFLVFFIMLISEVNAQQKKILIGINLHTIPANSYELTAALVINKHWEGTVRLGYTGKDGLRYRNHIDDNFENKTHSGYFFKSGARLIIKSRFFISGEFIVSHYVNTGWDARVDPRTYKSTEGTILGFGLSQGFRLEVIKEKLLLDLGVQLAVAQRRSDYVGTSNHNYQPGLGSLSGNPFVQGILALMLKI
jgi:hypothetical protein